MNEALQRYLDESPKLRAAAEADMMAARRKADAEAPFAIRQAIEQAPPVKRVKTLEAYSASSLYGVRLELPCCHGVSIPNARSYGIATIFGNPGVYQASDDRPV